MTSEMSQDPIIVHGVIKWFDPTKGFGFVLSDEGGADILLHANVLRNFGQGSVADGSRISILAQQTARGLQAVEVTEIVPPVDATTPLRDMEDVSDAQIQAAEILPARVKWFDKVKGFGFANVFGNPADVFVHVEVLRRSGLSDLQSGEAIGLRQMDGERGLMAIDILVWDAATR
jgi:CspA family cold shock protein